MPPPPYKYVIVDENAAVADGPAEVHGDGPVSSGLSLRPRTTPGLVKGWGRRKRRREWVGNLLNQSVLDKARASTTLSSQSTKRAAVGRVPKDGPPEVPLDLTTFKIIDPRTHQQML